MPNLHTFRHLPEIAINFGTLINTSVSSKEAVHGLYKRVVLHTNKKDISKDLAKRDNTLQTLRYLLVLVAVLVVTGWKVVTVCR